MFQCIPSLPDLNPQEDDAKFLRFSKGAEEGHLEQVDVQKHVLKYPLSSVYCAANHNRGWDSEFPRVDWERGTFQSCSLSQDH